VLYLLSYQGTKKTGILNEPDKELKALVAKKHLKKYLKK
jgi:hypothetical protein